MPGATSRESPIKALNTALLLGGGFRTRIDALSVEDNSPMHSSRRPTGISRALALAQESAAVDAKVGLPSAMDSVDFESLI